MKYMGSKKAMLSNGLGILLENELKTSRRFVDLFTGSAAVACHVAQRFDVPVLATDLQAYSIALANAVLLRRRSNNGADIWAAWHKRAARHLRTLGWIPSVPSRLTKAAVDEHRRWSERQRKFPLTRAYGGHYFSARQIIWIEALRRTLPTRGAQRRIALAALIQSVSQCVASPGHTAQPFQPTRTANKFLRESWKRSVQVRTKKNLIHWSKTTARKKGRAKKIDANIVVKSLRKTDLVFIDPPYSGVHYSRFYHVLEAVARNWCGEVSGAGRYPDEKYRPRSRYSIQTESRGALKDLLGVIASKGSKAILTFPNHVCSNGLSGYAVQKIASEYFKVKRKTVASRFSTLGGTGDETEGPAGRQARRQARELVLTLTP